MFAQLCGSTNEIFTSVVVYSRTNQQKKHTNKTYDFDAYLFVCEATRSSSILKDKRRKKMECTCMYAQLCSSKSAIFTSVVVYSRTTQTKKIIKKRKSEILTHFCANCLTN